MAEGSKNKAKLIDEAEAVTFGCRWRRPRDLEEGHMQSLKLTAILVDPERIMDSHEISSAQMRFPCIGPFSVTLVAG